MRRITQSRGGGRLALVVATGLLAASAAPVARAATPTDLFISEYLEGSITNNKAVEIFNGTGDIVDLAATGYQLALYLDGAGAPTHVISLSGALPPGSVYVVANNAATPPVQAQADLLSGALVFNGNDVVVLRKIGGQVVDSIGQLGTSPGPGWGADPTNTTDNTLVRLATVSAGDTDPTNSYDPSAEWSGHPADTSTFLGSHTFDPVSGGTEASDGVDATVTIAHSAACLELSTSAIDFGNLALGAENQPADPAITVTNCSSNSEVLLARGTNAAGPGASWNLVDNGATCGGALGLDNYRLNLSSAQLPAPIALATANKSVTTLAAGGSSSQEARIWTACPGSTGAGEVMTFQIHYLVTSP